MRPAAARSHRAGAGALRLDAAAVGGDQLPHHRQADARAAGAHDAATEEPVEHSRQLLRWDAWTGVSHAQHRLALLANEVDVDRAAGWGELQRVGQQVGGDLPEPGRVADDDQVGQARLDPDLPGGEQAGKLVHGVFQQRAQRHRLVQQREAGGLRGGQRLQVVDEPTGPQDLLVQRCQRLGVGLGDAVLDRLDLGAQDRQPQLVGDRGGELLPQPVLALQAVGEQVEPSRHLPELVSSGDRDPLGAVAGGQRASRPG